MIDEKIARKYCKEDLSKIKNYDKAIADKTRTWDCHHMTETWWNCTRKELIENDCYYNRKACELIFLTRPEHRRLHNMNMSDDTRKKISEANKGEKNPMYGKHRSEETRQKMSEAMKGRHSPMKGRILSEETRRKMSDAAKRRWTKKRGEV